MLIGVPKEIKNHEYRIGLTPAGARELVANGHQVVMAARRKDRLDSLAAELMTTFKAGTAKGVNA